MFYIFGINKRLKGKVERSIYFEGEMSNAVIKVYRFYFELFFIPLFPLHKTYSIYIPKTDTYFENNYFSKMPAKLLDICKDAGRNF
ncbi:hypothetical protein SAMN05421847_1361 [Halpernia humi]|uniref:Uncharacterized protein n=1 Tax=Halpernia humi TaxID=493375 RepID=A0A1H5WX85_9FLAO|nr:hypothetical protein [Halpernia humi]SEG03800.1 hypothetical protein SAMN05421847_1361 [Halpernia humi]